MNENRLSDYLSHILEAARDARGFVDGMEMGEFLSDRRTQQAVVMSLIIVGEAATRITERYPGFTNRHPEVPWRSMRGMRNRIAHGYFDINLEVVWNTVQAALPELIEQLGEIQGEADSESG